MKINVLLRETNVSLLDLEGDFAGVDKGAYLLLEEGITPKYAFGDFDSISDRELKTLKEKIDIEVVPSEKDYSDTELCLLSLVEKGYHDIDVYGAFGGRIDHALMNVQLLQNRVLQDANIHLKDQTNDLFLLKSGKHQLIDRNYKYISFIPIFNDTTISLSGFKYDGENISLSIGNTISVSNEFLSDKGIVETSKNIIVIYSKDEE